MLEPDSPGNSLRDIQDISLNLKLSLDGEKNERAANLETALGTEENAVERKARRESSVSMLSQKAGQIEKGESKISILRRRKYIFVIAVDCDMISDFPEMIKTVFDIARDGSAGSIGFILSTALTISETHSCMVSARLNPLDFDAFICNSGAELYYPSSIFEDGPGLPYLLDEDYHSHIEYRWGGEGLRKTLVRWADSINEKSKEGQVVEEDESGSTTHCVAFKVKNTTLVISFFIFLYLGRISVIMPS